MRFKQIVENSTTAGSVATVAKPMMTQTRENVNVPGLKPVQQVMKGKAKKKGPYANSITESKVKELSIDLTELTTAEFQKKYGKTKAEIKASMTKVNEEEIAEQDLIVIPGQGRLRRTGFVKHDLDHGEHEGHTLKNSLHTIARAASDLDKRLSVQSEFPEWVSEKIGAAKGMMVNVMDYLISSQEMQPDSDAINELSSDLLQRSAQLAKNKSNQAMKPEVHNALGGGYMNPLAKHYDDVSQKISNRAAQVGKKEAIKKIASPAVMRKIGMNEGDVSTSNLRTMYDLARMAKNYCNPEGQESLTELLKILKWYMDQAEQGVTEGAGVIAGGLAYEDSDGGEQIPQMAMGELRNIAKNCKQIHQMLKQGNQLDAWEYSYITVANDHIGTVADVLATDSAEGVAEDDSALQAFLSKGGNVQQLPYKKPRKADKTDYGSRHIGGGGDKMKASRTGTAANTQGSKVAGMREAFDLGDLRTAAASSRSPEDERALKRNPDFGKLMQKSVNKHNKAVVKTKKDIGSRVADIGAGGKEYNVKTDAAWDAAKKKVEEGWKSNLAGAALAGAAALGGAGAHAHEIQPIVAQITFQVDGKSITKDINLGTEYNSPGQASEAVKDFMKSKGIKFYNFKLHRADVQPPLVSKDEMDASNQEYQRQDDSNNLSNTPYSATGDEPARLQDRGYTSSSRPGASIAYESKKSIKNKKA